MPLAALFDGRMTWREAWHLTTELLTDPSSHVAAAVSGMKYPWSGESAVLADLYDLTAASSSAKGRRPKPYPRPVRNKDTARLGDAAGRDQAEVRAVLAARAR